MNVIRGKASTAEKAAAAAAPLRRRSHGGGPGGSGLLRWHRAFEAHHTICILLTRC